MTHAHRPDAQLLLPAEVCIEALIVAGGNTHLAAERLFGNQPNSVALLTASIAQDPLAQESLNAQLRTLTMLQLFDSLHEARVLLPATLPELEPADFVKYYLKVVESLSSFTTPPKDPSTPQDAVAKLINLLPPEARRAFMTLVGSTPDAPSPTGGEAALTSGGHGEGVDEAHNDAMGSHESRGAARLSDDAQPASLTGTEGEAA